MKAFFFFNAQKLQYFTTNLTALMVFQHARPVFTPFWSIVRPWTVSNWKMDTRRIKLREKQLNNVHQVNQTESEKERELKLENFNTQRQ